MKQISKLQYITNGQSESEILKEVKEVCDSGIDWIQLRIKNPNLDFLDIAKKVKGLMLEGITFIINDRIDIATEVDANGVHLGNEDMTITEARHILGDDKIIGGTANTIVDCKNLELEGADYIGLGPFRETTTKTKLSPVLGIDGYKEILPKNETYGWALITLNTPVVAIGGIISSDIEGLMNETGVHGIAVSGLISDSESKENLIKKLKVKLGWIN